MATVENRRVTRRKRPVEGGQEMTFSSLVVSPVEKM